MAYFEKRATGWCVQIRRKGRKSVSKTFRTKAAAERWAREVEQDMDNGRWLEASADAPTTLTELLERYLKEVSSKKKGYQDEVYRMRRVMRSEIGLIPIENLQASMFASWRDKRLQEVSAPTVRKDLAIINHAINTAMREWGIGIVANPLANVSRPAPNKARDRRLEEGEYQKLMDAMSSCRNELIKPIVQFALETAMRRGEILSLKWGDVDLDARVALLANTKNSESRRVPLSMKAIEILDSLPKESEVVFDTSGNSIRMAFDRVLDRAEIKDLRFHDLRHEATSRLFEKGFNIMEVSSITGHKDLSMLKRYTHLRAEDLVQRMG